MRRALSILLLAVLALPFCAPLMALAQDAKAGLPMCCRRNGAHHCQMSAMLRAGDPPTASDSGGARVQSPAERCPYCPAVAAGHAGTLHAAMVAQAIYAGVVSHPAVVVQSECMLRMARERARGKRGPPQILSSQDDVKS